MAKDITPHLEDLAAELSQLAKQIGLSAALEKLKSFGFFAGIEDANSEFMKRLTEESEEKQALARFLTRGDDHLDRAFPSLIWTREQGNAVFFESGSTIAHIVGEYARRLHNDYAPSTAIPKRVVTNNLFVLTALSDLVSNVAPIAGDLVTKYFGFFPAAEKDFAPNTLAMEDRRKRWYREFVGYNRLMEDVEGCTRIYATCSNFSFLAGPLVGSRGNAIAKHAIFSGVERSAELTICFHFKKLIASGDRHPSHADPKSVCFSVFPFDQLAKFKAAYKATDGWHEHWSNNKCPSGVAEMHQALIDFPDLPPTKPPIALNEWLAVCERMRILISLPADHTKGASDWLDREITNANAKLLISRSAVHYERNHDIDAQKWRVAEVIAKRR